MLTDCDTEELDVGVKEAVIDPEIDPEFVIDPDCEGVTVTVMLPLLDVETVFDPVRLPDKEMAAKQ